MSRPLFVTQVFLLWALFVPLYISQYGLTPIDPSIVFDVGFMLMWLGGVGLLVWVGQKAEDLGRWIARRHICALGLNAGDR